jgi:hypothetical protein
MEHISEHHNTLPHNEFSCNEVLLINEIFVHDICYCKYKGMYAAYRKISDTRVLICYFIGTKYKYTDTRKIQIIQYIDNKYAPFSASNDKLIKHRMHEFYYKYLPTIERMLCESILDSKLNISDDLINNNIFKYELHIDGNGNPTIKFNYGIILYTS